ncbi:remorin-like [Hibiscus syriacus]|uniref:remorin-like n=1 Tax=Hibiscus syriacus TaxID=106335 RepID=UPI00192224D6|nr:remorin-like [Hibiscus syriacus]
MAEVEEPEKLEPQNPSDPSPPAPEVVKEKPIFHHLRLKKTLPPSKRQRRSKKARWVYTVLARVATEKRISLVKAREESEKSKAENKAQKKLSSLAAWANSKKAALEAELKKIEVLSIQEQKAEYVEKMKNKIALIHKEAEEKKAMVEATREDVLKAEELAAKYRATGTTPKTIFGCF